MKGFRAVETQREVQWKIKRVSGIRSYLRTVLTADIGQL